MLNQAAQHHSIAQQFNIQQFKFDILISLTVCLYRYSASLYFRA